MSLVALVRKRCLSFILALAVFQALSCRPGDVLPPGAGDADREEESAATDGDADREVPAGALRVATFNTHLFFDTVCQSGRCDIGDFEIVNSETDFRDKARKLADAVAGLNADVVLLQEVETEDCLDALNRALSSPYPVAEQGETGSAASIDTAVLARGRLLERRNHRGTPIEGPNGESLQFTREFLELHLEIGGGRVIAFDAHFKSKASDDPDRRLAEAMAAHDIVTARAREYPDALVVFGGDLNDTPGSAPLDALENSGRLLRVAGDLPDLEAATYDYRGRLQAIDHLFMARQAAGELVSGSVLSVRGPVFGYGGSDHAALRADFLPGTP